MFMPTVSVDILNTCLDIFHLLSSCIIHFLSAIYEITCSYVLFLP